MQVVWCLFVFATVCITRVCMYAGRGIENAIDVAVKPKTAVAHVIFAPRSQ